MSYKNGVENDTTSFLNIPMVLTGTYKYFLTGKQTKAVGKDRPTFFFFGCHRKYMNEINQVLLINMHNGYL